MELSDLTPRQGKVLRYVTSCSNPPVTLEMCIIHLPWSDLPKDILQARHALEALRGECLVIRRDGGYWPTPEGVKAVNEANKQGIWR